MSGTFIHFDPTLRSATINLASYGFSSYDVIEVAPTGGFVSSTSPNNANTVFGQDVNVLLAAEYNGTLDTFGADNQATAYLLNAGLQLFIVNPDNPISDNADPNGDYGITVQKIAPLFSSGAETVDFNNLTVDQKLAAIALVQANDRNVNLYNGQGGSDTV